MKTIDKLEDFFQNIVGKLTLLLQLSFYKMQVYWMIGNFKKIIEESN